jgi:acyl-CoA synthetase (AMP-forming)/AMP-acid ligase II
MTMLIDEYLSTPEWSEPVQELVQGRPTLVWRHRPRHVVDLLRLSTARPGQDLLVHGERRMSFGTFLPAVDAGAAALHELGVRENDQVLIVAFNSAEYLLAMWAVWRIGAVPVLGNRWWSPRELAGVLGRTEPKVVITDASPADLDFGSLPVLRSADVESWWTSKTPPPDVKLRADEDEVAIILFTAGSTGAPKAVMLSHRNLVATQQTIHVMSGGRPPAPETSEQQSVALMTTPMFHLGGVTASLSALLDGNRMVLLRSRFDPREVLELIERERVTSWNAVPTMYARVFGHPDVEKYDLSSLSAPSTGGTMVPADVGELVRKRLQGARRGLGMGYGMTEMAFITMASGDEVATRPGTVGRPIPTMEIKVLDPDDTGEGQLIARSAAMMVGYLGAEQQPIDSDGWYLTGDLGRIDEDGYVYVTGRVKDQIIRGGENISCPYVEAALREHEDVLEVAVLGIPDPDLQEVVGAAVCLVEGSQVGAAELTAFARDRLAHFEVPARWLFLERELPVMATGKIDKVGLRGRFLLAAKS